MVFKPGCTRDSAGGIKKYSNNKTNAYAQSLDQFIGMERSGGGIGIWYFLKGLLTTSHPLGCLSSKRQTNVGDDAVKLELSYTAGGNVKWCSAVEHSLQVPQKLNTELPLDPEILLVGTDQEN